MTISQEILYWVTMTYYLVWQHLIILVLMYETNSDRGCVLFVFISDLQFYIGEFHMKVLVFTLLITLSGIVSGGVMDNLLALHQDEIQYILSTHIEERIVNDNPEVLDGDHVNMMAVVLNRHEKQKKDLNYILSLGHHDICIVGLIDNLWEGE